MMPRGDREALLGKKGIALISTEGRVSWVISGWIYTDKQLQGLGLKIVGVGPSPRKVIPFDQPWNPSDEELP